MLDLGVYPEFLDRAAVLHGLRKAINQSGNVETYFKLCKQLADAELLTIYECDDSFLPYCFFFLAYVSNHCLCMCVGVGWLVVQ
ncbi:hypothetical protein L1987_86005 [Smallanthus sonchifolius]|uniref:Uncharacterized protein n=1 Tax=Smallanthus sonchifolius TaxID=185202 RepID=A0ACB8XYV6_9ASTR|nr:hypothetical protein L1987_86005 [Smallanthus sonchifolius]